MLYSEIIGLFLDTHKTHKYKVVQIWPGQTVTSLHTISPSHIWTTLYTVWAESRVCKR
jgi:hypothetical protein